MRELELREKKINDIQATGERLIKDGHPGRKTVEVSYSAINEMFFVGVCVVFYFLFF